jgi:homopolymeric O-antigen transport system ATP-binding protein
MNDLAIQISSLSKRYRIGIREKFPTIRETLMRAASAPLHKVRDWVSGQNSGIGSEWIWALRDVDFEVKQGEVIGIIGRNGAGKTTLLKVLSGITEPTAGYADIYGRVGSLLEVGTGFHMELTGRENIFMNGAILGMRRQEIKKKFDEIVAFSEIEKFIDTPVKRYSSGMYVRLAFAVAAHLEPEILIVDEVLSVGDVRFQKKCLGKMQDISHGQGRTVLFVSHNMDSIQRLCSRCLILEQGELIAQGDTASTVLRYISSNSYQAQPNQWIDVSNVRRRGTGEARFVAIQYSSLNETVSFHPYPNGQLEFLLAIESDSNLSVASFAVTIYNKAGAKLVNADVESIGQVIDLKKGRTIVRLRIEQLHLNPNIYTLGLWLNKTGGSLDIPLDYIESACEIEVVNLESEDFGIKEVSPVTCKFKILEII